MRLVSFDAFRSLGIPGVTYIKPERFLDEQEALCAADWVLFPETWQLNTLLYALGRRIFPAPAGYRLGYDKIEMTRAFTALWPRHVPQTLIVANSEAGRRQALDELWFPMVLKEPRNSMGRGVHLIRDRDELAARAGHQPVLYLQEYLPIERDLRVVWVGDEIVTAYWRCGVDGFHNNLARGGEIDFHDIPEAALDLVRDVATRLGLDYAGFDIAMVGGHPYLIEFNLLFGNAALNERGIQLGERIHAWLLRQLPAPDNPPLLRLAG